MWRTRAAPMDSPASFGTSMVGDERVVTVTGELDLTNCSTFEKALLTAVAATRRGCELVVDLSGVRFFDVSALRALLAAADAAQAARVRLRLTASPVVGRVIDVLGADLSRADRGLIRTPDGVRPRISIPPST